MSNDERVSSSTPPINDLRTTLIFAPVIGTEQQQHDEINTTTTWNRVMQREQKASLLSSACGPSNDCNSRQYEIVGYHGDQASIIFSYMGHLDAHATAASNALSLVYGFGRSIDPVRTEALKKAAREEVLFSRPDTQCVQRGVCSVVEPVLRGEATSSFIPLDELSVTCMEGAKSTTECTILDSSGTTVASVIVHGDFAVVTLVETYDSAPLEVLDFLAKQLSLNNNKEQNDEEADDDDGDEYLLQSPSSLNGVQECGLWWGGWYPVETKIQVAGAHAIVTEVDDSLYAVKVKDVEKTRCNMLGTLQDLDNLLGMKSAVDRLSVALSCPVQKGKASSAPVGSILLALGTDQSGENWANFDHVIRAVWHPDDDSIAHTYILKVPDPDGAIDDLLMSSPIRCILSAAVLGAGSVSWWYGYSVIDALMIVIPLALRRELMPPWEILRVYYLCRKWRLTDYTGLSSYMDIRSYHDESAAFLALLLSPTTILGGVPSELSEWIISLVFLTIAVAYLTLLGIIYYLIQRQVTWKTNHYRGHGNHISSTNIVGGFCLGASNSDQHVPGGSYQWIHGCSRLAEDVGYGIIVLG